jgi:hypothetical protein
VQVIGGAGVTDRAAGERSGASDGYCFASVAAHALQPRVPLLEPNVTYHELRHVCVLVAVTFKKFSCLTCQ